MINEVIMDNQDVKNSIINGTYFSNNDIDNGEHGNKKIIYDLFNQFINGYITTRDINYHEHKMNCYDCYTRLREACTTHYKKMYQIFKNDTNNRNFIISEAYEKYIMRRRDEKKIYDFDIKKLINLNNYYIFGDTHGDFFPLISILKDNLTRSAPPSVLIESINSHESDPRLTYENVGQQQTIIFLGDVFDPFNGDFVDDVYLYGNILNKFIINSKIAFAQNNVVVFFYFIIYLLYQKNFRIYWILGNHDLSYGFLYFYFFYLFYLGSFKTCNLTFYFTCEIGINRQSRLLSHNLFYLKTKCNISNDHLYEKIYGAMTNFNSSHYPLVELEHYENENFYNEKQVSDLALVTSYDSYKTHDTKHFAANYTRRLDSRGDFYILFNNNNIKIECPYSKDIRDFQNLKIPFEFKLNNNIYGHVNHSKHFYFDEYGNLYSEVYDNEKGFKINFLPDQEEKTYQIVNYFSLCLDTNLSFYQISDHIRDKDYCCNTECLKDNAIHNKIKFMEYKNIPCFDRKDIVDPETRYNKDYNRGYLDYSNRKGRNRDDYANNIYYKRGYNHASAKHGNLDYINKLNREKDIPELIDKPTMILEKDNMIGDDMTIVGFIAYIKDNQFNIKNLKKDYQIHRFILTYDIYSNEQKENKQDYIVNAKIEGGIKDKQKKERKRYDPGYFRTTNRDTTRMNIYKALNGNQRNIYKKEIKKFTTINEILDSQENITWNFTLILNNLCLNEEGRQTFSPFIFNAASYPNSKNDIYYPLQTMDMEKIAHEPINKFIIKYDDGHMKDISLDFGNFIKTLEAINLNNEENREENADAKKFYILMIKYIINFLQRIQEPLIQDIYLIINIKIQYYFYLYKLYILSKRGILPYSREEQQFTFYDNAFIFTLLLYCTYENYISKLPETTYRQIYAALTPLLQQLFNFFSTHQDKRYLLPLSI